jgi:hypothetical protein
MMKIRVSLLIILALIAFIGCNAPKYTNKNDQNLTPFSPPTYFKYSLNRRQAVLVTIHNTSGAVVDTVANGIQEAGEHVIEPLCAACPSGIYFIRLNSEDTLYTKKILLLK